MKVTIELPPKAMRELESRAEKRNRTSGLIRGEHDQGFRPYRAEDLIQQAVFRYLEGT